MAIDGYYVLVFINGTKRIAERVFNGKYDSHCYYLTGDDKIYTESDFEKIIEIEVNKFR